MLIYHVLGKVQYVISKWNLERRKQLQYVAPLQLNLPVERWRFPNRFALGASQHGLAMFGRLYICIHPLKPSMESQPGKSHQDASSCCVQATATQQNGSCSQVIDKSVPEIYHATIKQGVLAWNEAGNDLFPCAPQKSFCFHFFTKKTGDGI